MSQKPVTVIIEREVLPEKHLHYEELFEKITNASRQFKGYIETHIVKPLKASDTNYQTVFRFDSQVNLDNWLNSTTRKLLVDKIDKLLKNPSKLQVLTGFETWFALPGKKGVMPPARYKMAIVTYLAITPLLIIYNFLLGAYLEQLSLVPRFIIASPGIVLIMTYLWMPLMSKIFQRWLYPTSTG